ncbi:hypothetical protein [Oceaniglobus trochenteri]|uniref:hypothetical protein n=1 Tax=Oceaniglobus trochenteri TaxID=2763260 RepID=UPI001FD906C2|nr:hypothetical protein [Oceaniglobus trochenteri]
MAVISRLFGACLRGFLVALLIATPALLLPGMSPDTIQVVMLVAVFAAILTVFEYNSVYPCLYEFRDAPPFNRIRFSCLFVTVFLLAVVVKGATHPGLLAEFVHAVGLLIARAIDFPYSPVRLVVLLLPEDAPLQRLDMLRAMAGLSYLISLISLAAFVVVMRLQRWPLRSGSFNVWVNLPTFDPTSGGEVVGRLRRDSRVNVVLGILLPFLLPSMVSSASDLFGSVSATNPQTLIWTVTAWAFLPASLLMRGIAMGRIASMIEFKRTQAPISDAGLLPA